MVNSKVSFLAAVVLLFAIGIKTVRSNDDQIGTDSSPKLRRLCGRLLVSAVVAACKDEVEQANQNTIPIFYNSYYDSHPEEWVRRGGILRECCVNQCTVEALARHCLSEEKLKNSEIMAQVSEKLKDYQ